MATERFLSPFYRGDTVRYALEFTNEDGTPQDVTNWVVTVTMKTNLNDADVDAALQVQTTLSGADALNGIGTVTLPSDETALVEPGEYHIDIQRSIPGSPPDVQTIHYQRINVLADVTRS